MKIAAPVRFHIYPNTQPFAHIEPIDRVASGLD